MTRRDSPPENADALDGVFRLQEDVFARKGLLEIGYAPEPRHIVARNEEIRRLATALNPAIGGGAPNNTFLYGKTGAGKSLCARYATGRIVDAASENGVSIARATIDCSQEDTETRAVRALAREINDPDETGIDVPETGFGRSRYYRLLWDVLDSRHDVALVVLDEIDRLENDELLLQLSRAEETGKLSRCSVGIVGISNKVRYRERLQERVKSSLQEREIIFAPYSRDDLREIIRSRSEAFRRGVLSDEVLSTCASLASEEHGDARKAINLIRHAGELAVGEESETITVDHVQSADTLAERDRFQTLFAGATAQQKATLLAIVSLALVERSRTFRTTDVYAAYEDVCADAGLTVLSKRRVHDLLREWEFLEVLDITRTGDGRARGSYLRLHLIEDPSVIRPVFDESSRFAGVGPTSGATATTWSNI